jgi:hypothetical protein
MSEAMMPMPQYQCHKKVWALQIEAVSERADGFALFFSDRDFQPKVVSEAWYRKHTPTAGGYFVQYQDGYESFSPKNAFEEGYTRLP